MLYKILSLKGGWVEISGPKELQDQQVLPVACKIFQPPAGEAEPTDERSTKRRKIDGENPLPYLSQFGFEEGVIKKISSAQWYKGHSINGSFWMLIEDKINWGNCVGISAKDITSVLFHREGDKCLMKLRTCFEEFCGMGFSKEAIVKWARQASGVSKLNAVKNCGIPLLRRHQGEFTVKDVVKLSETSSGHLNLRAMERFYVPLRGKKYSHKEIMDVGVGQSGHDRLDRLNNGAPLMSVLPKKVVY